MYGPYIFVEFQRAPLKFHKNILSIHWKMYISSTGENLRALRFKTPRLSVRWLHNTDSDINQKWLNLKLIAVQKWQQYR